MNKKKVCYLLIVLVLMSLILTACPPTPENPTYVAIINGVHKYTPSVNIDKMEDLKEVLVESLARGGSVYGVVADGQPYVIEDIGQIDDYNANNAPSSNEILAEDEAERFMSEFVKKKAKNNNCDLLSALGEAAMCLRGHEEENKEGEKKIELKIVVIDPGLSTEGVLDMAEETLLEIPPEELTNQLNSSKAFPDLKGIDIEWYNLGSVCGEQPYLDDSNKRKLEEIWNAILNESGAKSVNLLKRVTTNGKEYSDDLPSNKTVKLFSPKTTGWVFNEYSSIKFQPKSSEFVNKADAENELCNVANDMKDSTGNYCIYGMTATWHDPTDCINLSKKRAEACKKVLVDNGVSADRLSCVGLGQGDKKDKGITRAVDLDADGNLIEEKAKLNRAVYIVPV